jgi:hypothetical protein
MKRLFFYAQIVLTGVKRWGIIALDVKKWVSVGKSGKQSGKTKTS